MVEVLTKPLDYGCNMSVPKTRAREAGEGRKEALASLSVEPRRAGRRWR